MSTGFEDEVKGNHNTKLVSSDSFEDSLIFELQLDPDSDHEELEVLGSLEVEVLERVLESPFNRVKEGSRNPCPEGSTFCNFRQELSKVNDEVYKRVIKQGLGAEVDLERSKVTYKYAMFTESSTEPFDEQLGVVCVKDGFESLPGCHLALSTMKLKEEAYFLLCSSVMFGQLGCAPRVKPNADILLFAKIVKIDDTTSKEDEDMSKKKTPFKKFMKKAAREYSKAQSLFISGDFQSAIKIYIKWIDEVEDFRVSSDEDEARKKEILMRMYLNVSICFNKVKNPEKSCLMLRELERLTPIKNNPKALFAKGKALMMLDEYKRARNLFNMVAAIAPSDSSVASALDELDKKEQASLDYHIDRNKLEQKVEKEIQEVEVKQQQSSQEKRERCEALQADLKVFEEKLMQTTQEFKDNHSLEHQSLVEFDFSTAEHIKVAEKVCEQLGLRLKGTQKDDSDEFDFYLSKEVL